VAQNQLAFAGGPCNETANCQSVPPSLKDLFCDALNPNPLHTSGFAGVCRWCIPQTFSCDTGSSLGCCSNDIYTYECRISPAGGSDYYCLPRDGVSPNYLLSNWASIGGNYFRQDSHARTGSSSLYLEDRGSGSESFAYNTEMALNSSSIYLLEFWTMNPDGNPRYSIYDVNNDAYLSQDGSWAFSPMDGDNKWEQPVLIDLDIATSGDYNKYSRKFTTLSGNVSHVQLRFYPPPGRSAYIDDLELTQIYDFTMIVWFKPNGRQNARASIIWNGRPDSAVGTDWFMMDNGEVYIYMSGTDSAGNLQYFNPSSRVLDNNWHQLALTVQRIGSNGNGYYRAYLDAAQFGEGEFPVDRLNNSEQFWIGRSGGGDNAFKGRIDELRFYRRALSESEIAESYRGIYQKRLIASITSSYPSVPGLDSKDLASYYNADLRVRRLLSETVLSMPLDEPPSPEGLVADHSPMLSHGTNSGAEWAADGRSGGAYLFNGNGAQVNLSNASLAFGTSDFTVSAWINPDSYVSDGCGPNAIYAMGDSTPGVGLYGEQGTLAFSLGTGEFATGSDYGSLLNKWTHVAAVRKGGNLSLYENGTLAGSIESAQIEAQAVQPAYTRIGGSLCHSSTFSGRMDGFQAFARALPADEIGRLYNDTSLSTNSKVIAQNQPS
jgi:hypothetical protein